MKTMINKTILAVIIAQGLAFTALAQLTPSYTQYMSNLVPYNTAYSSLDNAGNANLIARKQWVGIEDSPSSFLFNGSVPLKSILGTAGLIVRNDNTGPEKMTDVNAFFSKAVRISEKSYFSASINAGLRSYKLDLSSIDANDQSLANNSSESKGNVGLGVMLYSTNYYVGASLPRFNISKVDRDKKMFASTYYFTAGYLKQLGADFKMKPAALVAYSGGNFPAQLDLSTTFYIKDIYGFGVNYRSNNELAGIASFMLNKSLQFGYSYQFGFGQGNINTGTHELTLGYRFGSGLLPKFL